MFYKVIQNGKIIDVLSNIIYVKIQIIHRCLMICQQKYAEGILSSNGNDVWFVEELLEKNKNNYPVVALKKINEEEYTILKETLDINDSIEDTSSPSNNDEITEDEKMTLEFIRSSKISEMNNKCNTIISAGFDVMLSDAQMHHFSLTVQDQLNLITLSTLVSSGETAIPYHADGELCKYYSVKDINTILTMATTFKTYHTTYFNTLKQYINTLNTITEINQIQYGMNIPKEYYSEVLTSLYQAISNNVSNSDNNK